MNILINKLKEIEFKHFGSTLIKEFKSGYSVSFKFSDDEDNNVIITNIYDSNNVRFQETRNYIIYSGSLTNDNIYYIISVINVENEVKQFFIKNKNIFINQEM